MQLLTTAEAAEYLRLKERKLYELVAENALPCMKVTGRWLFPKEELDRWLNANLMRPESANGFDRLPIVGGSHDPLLEWALRESGSGLAGLQEGSEAGLARFIDGKITAVAIHLHSEQEGVADANITAFRSRAGLSGSVLVSFARREQGILAAPGNPLKIASIGCLVRKQPRVLIRQKGAGAQLLLEALLAKSDLSLDRLKLAGTPCTTGSDLAQAIRMDRGDCGIATRAAASAAGLHFIPLLWEQFDLVVRHSEFFRPPFQKLLQFVRTEAFASRAAECGGYDIAKAGDVRASV